MFIWENSFKTVLPFTFCGRILLQTEVPILSTAMAQWGNGGILEFLIGGWQRFMVFVLSRVENCIELRWSPPWWARRNGTPDQHGLECERICNFDGIFHDEFTVCEQKVVYRFTLTLWCIWHGLIRRWLCLSQVTRNALYTCATTQEFSIQTCTMYSRVMWVMLLGVRWRWNKSGQRMACLKCIFERGLC